MPKVRYIGTSNIREITAADWKSIGVEGQKKVTWDRDKKEAHDISDEALAWLEENEPGSYEVVTDDPVTPDQPLFPPIPPSGEDDE